MTQQHPINRRIDCRLARRQVHPEPLLEHPSNLALRHRVQIRGTQNVLNAPLQIRIARYTRTVIRERTLRGRHVQIVGRRSRDHTHRLRGVQHTRIAQGAELRHGRRTTRLVAR